MAQKAPHKILRVGIIQNETVLEERVIRRREPITIGASPRSTFIVPVPEMTRPYPLIQIHEIRHQLQQPDIVGVTFRHVPGQIDVIAVARHLLSWLPFANRSITDVTF